MTRSVIFQLPFDQVSGSSTGAPLLLLADDHELDAVKLWLASAAPKYEAGRNGCGVEFAILICSTSLGF